METAFIGHYLYVFFTGDENEYKIFAGFDFTDKISFGSDMINFAEVSELSFLT